MPATRTETTLDERARALLEANTQTAELDGRLFRFTVPCVRDYPFQWFWDSCFHAIVWSRFDRSARRTSSAGCSQRRSRTG